MHNLIREMNLFLALTLVGICFLEGIKLLGMKQIGILHRRAHGAQNSIFFLKNHLFILTMHSGNKICTLLVDFAGQMLLDAVCSCTVRGPGGQP